MESFKVFDRDNDGKLSRFEIKQLLMASGINNMDHIEDILDELDNGNDLISCEDYVERMLQDKEEHEA